MKRSAKLMGTLILSAMATLFVGAAAIADFTFGTPKNLGPVVNCDADVIGVSISHDGMSLYFCSDHSGGYGSYDLWVAMREEPESEWGAPVNLGPVANSAAGCMAPSISADGLLLYFSDVETPTSEGPLIPGGIGSTDIWVITRGSTDGQWGPPTNLRAPVNHVGGNICPSISADGLSLHFCSGASRGGSGFYDIWLATRKSVGEQWDSPINLGPTVNTGRADIGPSISSDGQTLYFVSNRPGGYGQRDIWQVPLIPIADFNADGQVDLVDLVMLIDTWGTDTVLCDIGPMPWGDGKVDIEDLKVFVTEWEKENPPAQP